MRFAPIKCSIAAVMHDANLPSFSSTIQRKIGQNQKSASCSPRPVKKARLFMVILSMPPSLGIG